MHAMQMAVDYARTRYQFGRAIGSFQAIKLHVCRHAAGGTVGTLGSTSRSAGLRCRRTGPVRRSRTGTAYCSEAFVAVAANTIQVHGGIGFTWEHPAHLYLRRARTDAQLFGDPVWHRERYIRLREAGQ